MGTYSEGDRPDSMPSLFDELQRIGEWERRYATELAGLTEADGSVRKLPPRPDIEGARE